MADVPRTAIQGELHWKKQLGGSLIGTVVPHANPSEWYFVPFPTMDVMEAYALQYGLALVEQEEKK
jgi:hypothetical protein